MLGQPPGRIGPQEAEGDAARARPAEGDEAVRDLLKARRIKLAQCLDVVAQALRVGEKAVVGKDDGAGEVGAEGQESEAPCGVRAQWRRAYLGLDGVAGRQFGIEARQLELAGGGDGAGL